MGKNEQDAFFQNLYDHSMAKLNLLDRYLIPWMRKILLGLDGKCLIADTFAGTGYYEDGSKGSPIILIDEAINCVEQLKKMNNKKLDKIVLVFVEKDKKNYDSLKSNIEKEIGEEIKDNTFNQLNKYPNIYILVTQGTHEKFVNTLVGTLDYIIPSFIFVDPFGYKPIPMKSLACIISKYNNCEILINFMYEDINRFFLKDDSEKFLETMCQFYGDNFFEVREQVKTCLPENRRETIIEGYKNNLKSAGAKYVLDFDIHKNGKVKMVIVFATKNVNGFDTMKETIIKICKDTDFEYKTKKPQLSLFDSDEYKETVLEEKISDYVYNKYKNCNTPYLILENDLKEHETFPSCYLKKTLKKLEREAKIENVIKIDGTKRKKGTFPDNTIIFFN